MQTLEYKTQNRDHSRQLHLNLTLLRTFVTYNIFRIFCTRKKKHYLEWHLVKLNNKAYFSVKNILYQVLLIDNDQFRLQNTTSLRTKSEANTCFILCSNQNNIQSKHLFKKYFLSERKSLEIDGENCSNKVLILLIPEECARKMMLLWKWIKYE